MLSRQLSRIGCVALLTCLGILAWPVTLHAETEAGLVPFEASYTAAMEKGLSLNGTSKRTLTSQGNDVWLYRTDVDSFIVSIDESLVFRWEDDQVIPMRYRYRLSGFLVSDRKNSIDFDWSAGIATGEYKGKPFELELEEGLLDPLGYQLQLHQDIKNGKREMTYRVLDGNSIDTDRFAVINGEKMSTGSQQRSTLKAEKVREDSKRQTLMWFSPEQNFLLVRLRQVEPDGSTYELKLKEAEFER
ncbi:hypothetical protein A8B84_13720 [Marinobacter sp. EhC06]|jgi:hypothetical protein|uniref:DUF3108 domain-containing protein n=1 Tax=Marinobacter TaxID=2742 RepID=UPI0007D95EB5|nr:MULTISPECIES: DUF3108 domain-containing protein [unclassified Marinobacter]OAN86780.1 hypothetical protein A8B80_11410 [Marinobacter sp. EhN04]OAN89308.1 hypothetical protein A8B84_13720 [Marinobacter sp. EhC06]